MIRLALSFSISSAVLALGLVAAWIQSKNYARAADMDWMQEQCEWYRRRCSGLEAELARFELELRFGENAALGDRVTRGDG